MHPLLFCCLLIFTCMALASILSSIIFFFFPFFPFVAFFLFFPLLPLYSVSFSEFICGKQKRFSIVFFSFSLSFFFFFVLVEENSKVCMNSTLVFHSHLLHAYTWLEKKGEKCAVLLSVCRNNKVVIPCATVTIGRL